MPKLEYEKEERESRELVLEAEAALAIVIVRKMRGESPSAGDPVVSALRHLCQAWHNLGFVMAADMVGGTNQERKRLIEAVTQQIRGNVSAMTNSARRIEKEK